MKFKKHILISFTFFIISFFAWADGPVPASSLPGGATSTDNDTGNGELWGRVDGRDWAYSGFDLTSFTSLTWGPVDNTSVGIAFDGTINSGTAEELSLSSVTGNQAIWTGSTQVYLVIPTPASYANVDTRFVLTLSSGGLPINFQINSMSGLPFVDVMAANGQFAVNLKMEAKLSTSNIWEPALNLFDRLSTDPISQTLAQTSFRSGFFFTLSGAGLSLEEHDANMISKGNQLINDIDFLKGETVGRLTQILNDTNYLKGETVGRLTQILNDTQTIESLIQQLLTTPPDQGDTAAHLAQILNNTQTIENLIQQLLTTPPDQGGGNYPTADEIRTIVSERLEEITNILIFLWGVDTSQGPPDPSTVTLISDLATQEQILAVTNKLYDLQQQLSDIAGRIQPAREKNILQLEVVNSKGAEDHSRKLLILSTENGEAVDVTFVAIQAIVSKKKQASTLADVTFTSNSLASGLVELNLNLPKSLKSTKTFTIKAQHQDANGDVHYETTLVSGKPFEMD